MSEGCKLDFSSQKRSRRMKFKNRKKSLIKKIEQLSILCGIDVGAIIFPNHADADADADEQQLIVWPGTQHHIKIQQLVSLYKENAGGGCDVNREQSDAANSDDHNSGDSSSEPENSNMGTSCIYHHLSLHHLKQLVHIVQRRIAAVDNKIEFLRKSQGMRSDPPEMVCNTSHRCRCSHAVHCCCRGCSVVDPQCSHHCGVNITLHGTCNYCVPDQMEMALLMHSNHHFKATS